MNKDRPVQSIYKGFTSASATREGFGKAILEIGKKNKDVVVLTANLAASTCVAEFAKEFPHRFFDVGVAEQNLASIGAGFALAGKIPFLTSFAAFSPTLNWGQIRLGISYNRANVKIVSTHAGLSVGADGASHQALEDIALMRVLPNMTVISPCDANEAYQATIAAANWDGPVYLRLGREPSPVITKPESPFKIGPIAELKTGKKIAIIATGFLVHQALEAAKLLSQKKIAVGVYNCPTIKPIDEAGLMKIAKTYKTIITLEEHQVAGGLGGAIAETITASHPVRLIRLGMPDAFGESGKPQELLSKYHLNAKAIVNLISQI